MQNLKKNWLVAWKMSGHSHQSTSPEHSKVSKLELWWDPFVQSRKWMNLKFTEKLSVMTMKNNANFEEVLTWGTSQILTWALESLKHLCFNWLLVTKVYIVWATKVQRSYLSWHWRVMQILKNKLTCGFKIGTLMGSFCPKQKRYDLKIYRGVMYHNNEE